MLQRVAPLLSLCVLFLLLATAPSGTSRRLELLEVSVLLRESDSTARAATRQGMEQAAADLGAELRFLILTEANQVEEQQTIFSQEIEAGADAIVLIPTDRTALAEDVASASVPVVTLETDMSQQQAVYVGVDNQEMGETLAQAALNGVAAGGQVLLLDSLPGDTGVHERLQSAADALLAADRAVSVCRPGDGQSLETALKGALATQMPDLILAFEAAALETAARTIESLEAPPLLYGMGATNTVAAYLEQGTITAIAAQNEFAAGYLAVQTAVQMAREKVPHVETLTFTIVRKETMYGSDYQKLLFPVTR